MRIKNRGLTPPPRALARRLLRGVYSSERLRELLKRKEWTDALRAEWISLRRRSVKPQLSKEDERRAHGVTLLRMSGNSILMDTLTGSSTYRELYERARILLGLQLRGSPVSLTLSYAGRNPYSHEANRFAVGEIIPCNDALCQHKLRGSILQIVMHR